MFRCDLHCVKDLQWMHFNPLKMRNCNFNPFQSSVGKSSILSDVRWETKGSDVPPPERSPHMSTQGQEVKPALIYL